MPASLEDFIKKYDTQMPIQTQQVPQAPMQNTPQQDFNPDMGALADPGMVGAAGEMVMAPAAIAGYPIAKATEYAGKGLTSLGGPMAYRPEMSFGDVVRKGFGQPLKGGQAPSTGEMLAEAGAFLAMPKISEFAGPLAAKVSKAITDKFPKWLVDSALKIPTKSVDRDIRLMARDKVLNEGYLPTEATLERIPLEQKPIREAVRDIVDEGTKAGDRIHVDKMLEGIQDLKIRYSNMDNPEPYIKALDKYADAMRNAKGAVMTPYKVQELKKQLYRMTKDDWKANKISPLKKDFWKSVSIGAKEELEALYPQLKTLNKKDADLINLYEVLERSVNRIRNYDVVRLGDVITASAGAAAYGPEGGMFGYLFKRAVEAPVVKTRLAIALKKAEGKSLGLTKTSRMATGLGSSQIQSITSKEDYDKRFSQPNSDLDDFIKKYGEQ